MRERIIARPSVPRPVALGFAFVSALVFGIVGCSSDNAPGLSTDGPGSKVVAGIIACKADADCKSGESCGEGFCQMKRCADPSYNSVPPFGTYGYAAVDRAFVASSDNTTLQVFSAHGNADISTKQPPLDLAGGNLTGSRPESLAVITSDSTSVSIVAADGTTKDIALGWQGKAVATGDVDGDGIDEVVVLGEGTQYAICRATRGECEQKTLAAPADDVAVGDVDGDGLGEVLFIGNNMLTVVNVNPDVTGEKETISQPVSPDLVHITAGDLDGDGVAEIIGTEANTVFSDKLYVFRLGKSLVQQAAVDLTNTVGNDALDVAFARQDDKPLVAVLSNEYTLQLFSFANATLTDIGRVPVSSGNARRITASDVNGRSAVVRLKGPAALQVGPPVPIAVLTAPPYSAAHSAGPSSATLGTSDETSDGTSAGSSKTTSISLMLGVGVTTPIGSLHGFFTSSWSQTASHSKAVSTSLSIGKSYTITADPQADGFNSGGVVLAGGCFHRYDYAVEDPAKLLSDGGSTDVSSYVPVGGETTLWSTNRYNALVDAIGGNKLPKVTIGSKLGSVASYPSKPTTLDGKPIPKADNVFSKAPLTRSSDVGTVSFSLTASENTTNTDASSFSYGQSISGQVGATIAFINPSVQITKDDNWGLDESYSVTVGTSTSFSGQISPVHDDPSTPANESSVYGYSFQPVVYREHFKDATGKDGAFYVLTYTAGK